MEYMEFKGKTKNDAITEACKHFSVPSDKLDYEVIDEGKTGFLGMGSRPAFIKARVKEEKEEVTETVELLETLVVESVPVDEAKSKDNNKNDIVHEDIDVQAGGVPAL